jgi:replicative DNA helicase
LQIKGTGKDEEKEVRERAKRAVKEMELVIIKNRYGETGDNDFTFRGEYSHFEENATNAAAAIAAQQPMRKF